MECKWTREQTIEFIQCYESHSLLWDCKHESYKDRNKRYAALNEMAKKFGTQVMEVERKIKNLQSHFLRERKRIQLSHKKTPSSWFAYKPLSFLLTRNKPEFRRRKGTSIKESNTDTLHRGSSKQECSQSTSNAYRQIVNTVSDKVTESQLVVKEMFKWFKERDEFDLYGEQVAIKLRNITSPVARVTVQNQMNTLLMQAELGMYNTGNNVSAEGNLYLETKASLSESDTA